MSRRIDIELTSTRPDGSWTWRAAGAKQPKGDVDGSMLPSGSKVGDVLKVDIERKISRLPQVTAAVVDIVLDPPWSPALMSEAAKLELGML